MKTKYFSNSGGETLEDLKESVNKWITTRKNINVIEMKTSSSSKSIPPEFFICMSYDDKSTEKMTSSTMTPRVKRRF